MCGIVGIFMIENHSICKRLIHQLEELQNRGYDSCGIAYIEKNHSDMVVHKAVGKTQHLWKEVQHYYNLHQFPEKIIRNIEYGIGHTRWATHGNNTVSNAHPHRSNKDEIYLVHNGIIQNDIELRKQLKENDYFMYSETDSELIAILIADQLKYDNNIIHAIENCKNELKGTYAVTLCHRSIEGLICFRKGSPLLIGLNEKNTLYEVVSEKNGFSDDIVYFSVIPENVIVMITEYGIEMYEHGSLISKNKYCIWNHFIKEKEEKYEGCYMIKEIKETMIGVSNINDEMLYWKSFDKFQKIMIIGCGSSYYVGMVIKSIFLELNIDVIDAYEFDMKMLEGYETIGMICISQSGETRDILEHLELINELDNITKIGIINVEESSIAREMHINYYMKAGKEKSVASTKSFNCALYILYEFMYRTLYDIKSDIIEPSHLKHIYDDLMSKTDKELKISKLNKSSIFILGNGYLRWIASEYSLKLKEVCYIHAEGYSGGSLKHGPFALIELDYPIIILVNRENHMRLRSVIQEVLGRGAFLYIISNIRLDMERNERVFIYEFESINKETDMIIYSMIGQIISYRLSIYKGLQPDYPRNLAKVVTVE